jgi:hypothetical protein
LHQWIEDRIERVPISGCWIWTGTVHHSGYGQFRRKGAHRLVYQALVDEDIAGKCLCHHCDIKLCVNPEHLFIGTQKDNIDDMDKKGRRVKVPGERNGRTHLTEADVLAIRIDTRTIKKVAAAYGIGKSQVSNIKSRYSWKHI